MDLIIKIVSLFLSVVFSLSSVFPSIASKNAEKFRLTAYFVGDNFSESDIIDASHFEQLTDVILIGVTHFDTEGNINLSPNFELVLNSLRRAMQGSDARLHLNLLGPDSSQQADTWEEQMNLRSIEHNKAFTSGRLEGNIKAVLDEYGFDGVFFDYEYPLTKEHYKVFDSFIISLDKVLGDDYVIGCAISGWNALQSKKAIRALDMVEVMAYDMWDADGTHSSVSSSKDCIYQMLKAGYPREKLDLGIPFYARPTNHDAYWYSYNGYADKLDENGLCYDENTDLTFSFNTCDAVTEKTQWAIRCGLGGAMVWHYSCDVPADNAKSLFNAMYEAKTGLIEK